MRLVGLTVENFRCYSTPVELRFDDLTALVGQNDVGKSALMDALAIFFEAASPDKDDACKSGDPKLMRITCEFDQLPERLVVDADFPTSLLNEHLLDARGRLVIRKTYNGSLATPKVTEVAAIAEHPTAEGYYDLLQLKKAELASRANELRVDLEHVDKRKNAAVRAAIWAASGELKLRESAVPLDEEGGKQVWSALLPYLPSFALFKSDRASTDQDSEAQDPLKAAIREAVKSVESKLIEVKEHVEKEVKKIAEATVEKLREMDPSVAATLDPVITTKKWESLFHTSITGDDGIPLNKRGSGVKRLVLLNFFRAKAEKDAASSDSGSVVYAIEEPETSQHPKNQRLLLSALRELASESGRQIVLTTHTPMLARCLPDDTLRFIQKDEEGRRWIEEGNPETRGRIAKALGVLPDHNVRVFIGVEGPNDIDFLKGVARALIESGEDVPDLDRLEMDGEVIFFPFGGSNLAIWASRLRHLNRPEYHICDRDYPPPKQPKYAEHMSEINQREGCTAVATEKREMENYLHPDAIREAYAENGLAIAFSGLFEDFDDVPALVAQIVHQATSDDEWAEISAEKQKDKIKRAKRLLNGQAAQRMSPDRLAETDTRGEIRGWLLQLGQTIAGAAD